MFDVVIARVLLLIAGTAVAAAMFVMLALVCLGLTVVTCAAIVGLL